MNTTQAKLKTTKIEAGRYVVSVNGVPCFDLDLSLDDGYRSWVIRSMNESCDWSSSENTKRDCIESIWILINYHGIDHVLANYSN